MNVKLLILLRNWLGGTLLGPKRTILRHTSPIFLIVALKNPLRLAKKWPLFCLRRDHANQLLYCLFNFPVFGGKVLLSSVSHIF